MIDGHVIDKDYNSLKALIGATVDDKAIRFHQYKWGGFTPYAR